jgi:hypothetical protein
MPARNSRLLLLSLAFLLLASLSKVIIAEPATAAALRDVALQSERAWQIVESLTTEIGPRLAGTPADHLAVKWAQSQLKASGFDRVWLEPVKFPVWQRHKEQARIVSPSPSPWPLRRWVTAAAPPVRPALKWSPLIPCMGVPPLPTEHTDNSLS